MDSTLNTLFSRRDDDLFRVQEAELAILAHGELARLSVVVQIRQCRKTLRRPRTQCCWNASQIARMFSDYGPNERFVLKVLAPQHMPRVFPHNSLDFDRNPPVYLPLKRSSNWSSDWCNSRCIISKAAVRARMLRPRPPQIVEVNSSSVWRLVKCHANTAHGAARIRVRKAIERKRLAKDISRPFAGRLSKAVPISAIDPVTFNPMITVDASSPMSFAPEPSHIDHAFRFQK